MIDQLPKPAIGDQCFFLQRELKKDMSLSGLTGVCGFTMRKTKIAWCYLTHLHNCVPPFRYLLGANWVL